MTAQELTITMKVLSSIHDVDAKAWDLLTDGNPFVRHAFLATLEDSQCIGTPESGWYCTYMVAYHKDKLVGAVPAFVKTHSQAEFVYDFSWADAAHRAGIQYYPKLVVAAPLSPVTGPRLLVSPDYPEPGELRQAMIMAMVELTTSIPASGLHLNFLEDEDLEAAQALELGIRYAFQYHWINEREDGQRYEDFDDFLRRFRSKRRANIRRERRKLAESGVTTRVVTGDEITEELMVKVFYWYRDTVRKYYWGNQYLTEKFFRMAADTLRDQLHIVVASIGGQDFAGTFNLIGKDRLYGRYWGCEREVEFAHFEVCFYQPILWCIENGYAAFEPGHGGEHKFERGFLPQITFSAHWLEHPPFFDAVLASLAQEGPAVKARVSKLMTESPILQK